MKNKKIIYAVIAAVIAAVILIGVIAIIAIKSNIIQINANKYAPKPKNINVHKELIMS